MTDDNLTNALTELAEVDAFSTRFDGPNNHRFDGTFAHTLRAVRYLIAEVEALRDEVAELRAARS